MTRGAPGLRAPAAHVQPRAGPKARLTARTSTLGTIDIEDLVCRGGPPCASCTRDFSAAAPPASSASCPAIACSRAGTAGLGCRPAGVLATSAASRAARCSAPSGRASPATWPSWAMRCAWPRTRSRGSAAPRFRHVIAEETSRGAARSWPGVPARRCVLGVSGARGAAHGDRSRGPRSVARGRRRTTRTTPRRIRRSSSGGAALRGDQPRARRHPRVPVRRAAPLGLGLSRPDASNPVCVAPETSARSGASSGASSCERVWPGAPLHRGRAWRKLASPVSAPRWAHASCGALARALCRVVARTARG